MSTRKTLEGSINETIVPYLVALGFSVMGEGRAWPRWREGRYLQRIENGREQIVLIGKTKHGATIGINVGYAQPDGSYRYMNTRDHGLKPELLGYGGERGADVAVKYLLSYFQAEVIPWLRSA
jgi:hypothetical protein